MVSQLYLSIDLRYEVDFLRIVRHSRVSQMLYIHKGETALKGNSEQVMMKDEGPGGETINLLEDTSFIKISAHISRKSASLNADGNQFIKKSVLWYI